MGEGALRVGVGEQNLADDSAFGADAPHGANLIAGLAILDDGVAANARPRIVIEGTNDGPDPATDAAAIGFLRPGDHCTFGAVRLNA